MNNFFNTLQNLTKDDNKRNFFYIFYYLFIPITFIILLLRWRTTFTPIHYPDYVFPEYLSSFLTTIVYILIFALLVFSIMKSVHLMLLVKDKIYAHPVKIHAIHIITLIATSGFLTWALIPPASSSKPYQLFLSNEMGMHGIPNIDLYWYSSSETQNECYLWNYNTGDKTIFSEENPTNFHLFSFVDLLPNTKYIYSINSGLNHSFTTSGLDSFRIALGADSHFGHDLISRPTVYENLLEQSNDIAYFGILGDLTQTGNNKEWDVFFNHTVPYTRSLPFFSTIGNHDAFFNNEPLYGKYLLPNNENYYQHIPLQQNVHLILLDYRWGPESVDNAQRQWLIHLLEGMTSEDRCFIMGHGDLSIEKNHLLPVFEEYSDVISGFFNGHRHRFLKNEIHGIPHYYVGSLSYMRDHSDLPDNGFLILDIQPNSFEVSYRNDQNQTLYSQVYT